MKSYPTGLASRLPGAQPPVPSDLEILATIARYTNGEPIFRPTDPAEFCYRILSGAVRKCTVTSAGSRRIVDILFPRTLFGVGEDRRHRFAVEAAADNTTIARYPKRLVDCLADSDPRIARQIREAACESIDRLEARMLILGLGRARERVCAFLLQLAERNGGRHQPEICLPMSRYDVADYLAMAVETVSRVLTQLRLEGVIRLSGARRIWVCDWNALEGDCGATSYCKSKLRGNGYQVAAPRGEITHSA